VFKVILTGPVPTTDFLNKAVGKWVARIKSSAPKRKKGLKQAIKTPEDWDKKIHQPQIKNIKAMFKDDIVTRKGLTKAEMIARAESEKDEKCQKYFKTREKSFKDKSFEKGVEERKWRYERGRIKYFLLYGSKKENVKGLISLGVMALCGDPAHNLSSRGGSAFGGQLGPPKVPARPVGPRPTVRRDGRGSGGEVMCGVDLMKGNPVCITSAEKLGEFKSELRSQMARLGAEIIQSGYDQNRIKDNCEELNRLVDGYRLAEFAPFKPGAESPRLGRDSAVASHIDFIVVEIPDPAKHGEMKKWLGLDIQVSEKD